MEIPLGQANILDIIVRGGPQRERKAGILKMVGDGTSRSQEEKRGKDWGMRCEKGKQRVKASYTSFNKPSSFKAPARGRKEYSQDTKR